MDIVDRLLLRKAQSADVPDQDCHEAAAEITGPKPNLVYDITDAGRALVRSRDTELTEAKND